MRALAGKGYIGVEEQRLALVATVCLVDMQMCLLAVCRLSNCRDVYRVVEKFLGQPKEAGGLGLHDADLVVRHAWKFLRC